MENSGEAISGISSVLFNLKSAETSDETLKPYFPLYKAETAIFDLALLLYGLSFVRTAAIPVYHNEVRTFEVYDSDRSLPGILCTDYHPRKGKDGGALMTSFSVSYSRIFGGGYAAGKVPDHSERTYLKREEAKNQRTSTSVSGEVNLQ